MKKIEPYTGFEQGPIRPPSESGSLLIRITRNCPWNRCTFCPVYKGTKFSLRPVEHVLKDIDQVHQYVKILQDSQLKTRKFASANLQLSATNDGIDQQALYAAKNFIASGMKSIFLQDGNSLIIRPGDMIPILQHLKKAFPSVERVTSYARSHTIARIGDKDLRRIAEAGLNRIHIGMESGSDKVLKMVRKGTNRTTQILAGQKVKKAGMELSEYYMPGLGGRKLSQENALETADALNQINPDFIRLRTLALPNGTPLAEQYEAGEFDKMGDVDTARELLLFLESLKDITSTVKSDHVLNLFTEVEGTFPEEKEKMVAPIQEFLQLDPQDQMVFCIGKRTRRLSKLEDLKDLSKHRFAEQMCADLGATTENMDAIVDSIIKQFI
ncbi:MAG: radical SAM protein [Deltaproteobacteria bacterium]|nr:radical SAM protein [Deltaproteobacteria bacterium]